MEYSECDIITEHKKRKRCDGFIKSTRSCRYKEKGCQFNGYEYNVRGERVCFRKRNTIKHFDIFRFWRERRGRKRKR